MSAIEIAERAVAANARETERRYVRAMAEEYAKADRVGNYFDASTYIKLTRYTIRRYGHLLHYQINNLHPYAQGRIRNTRITLFGEILLLKRQLETSNV